MARAERLVSIGLAVYLVGSLFLWATVFFIEDTKTAPVYRGPAPLGLDMVGIDERGIQAACITGSSFQKFRAEPGYVSDPGKVEQVINRCGVRVAVLHFGNRAYNWRGLRDLWFNNGWGDLVKRRGDIQWWIEVGNEPEVFTDLSPEEARTKTLETYKYLALGWSGDQPWRDRYPNLKWLASAPVNYGYFHRWFRYVPDDREGRVNMGHIADWYDGVGLHLYGDSEVFSWNYDMPYIYHAAIQHPSVKNCIVTEIGINNGSPSNWLDDAAGFATWTPCLGVAAFAYFPGDCQYDSDSYEICRESQFRMMREYNQ